MSAAGASAPRGRVLQGSVALASAPRRSSAVGGEVRAAWWRLLAGVRGDDVGERGEYTAQGHGDVPGSQPGRCCWGCRDLVSSRTSHQHSLATTHGECGGPSHAATSPRITVQKQPQRGMGISPEKSPQSWDGHCQTFPPAGDGIPDGLGFLTLISTRHIEATMYLRSAPKALVTLDSQTMAPRALLCPQ